MKTYNEITEKIILALERERIPWEKPWVGKPAQNFISKKAYNGINALLLNLSDFSLPYFATFKQVSDIGGRILLGEKSTEVIYWNFIDFLNQETGKLDKIPFLKTYRVFNLAQCWLPETIKADIDKELKKIDFKPIEKAQAVFDSYKDKPSLAENSSKAAYNPVTDIILMPVKNSFSSKEEFYLTLFHEAVHSTGHEKRLDRESLTAVASFGSHEYSKEELVAEIGASFLSSHSGIDQKTFSNSVSYCRNWAEKLRENKKWIFWAAGQAQKATNYILGIKTEERRK
ncbi:MAG TPA: zincin-like metallopeptidase domain-containing protein [Thermodesulfovibrionia bacterium]|nr:zincin-like metallopeptidase domain-containing protein [Thermodesulfovibrionia bacterium]